ncbi:ribosome maturation factor RimM [Ketogulonicigenium vulgare]|uniref:Ribosome maturation factor RimM n=1 Tax=Ketogulonicigenium vulgare (strain WSH-001) TaxID=759362 RepID=F9Y7G9_KETVW|nr:ribosome maturation factor RimM [Ketogulonicigenium vulgare]ADO41275.1 putative 16S rRNA processing protein [Ketogulonicigenium vulgare Y25]AEM42265.1 Ribosome maturation factor rimM [Ketogulonicigenium vulgare WSH-001]ALJ79885.1 16S rRNA-processing protein RimM [Ketogulonicigenium vulgare]ANW32787.1 16S rRNA processing protein RimM [Ketogulonicigenium vulgare]AOZ53101.1 16S rRNA processing protein [Ketogulonicigenium vulgare]
MSDRIVLGQIAGSFGVRGDLRLKSFCAIPEDIAIYTPLYTDDGRVFRVVVITGQTNGALVARIEGISSKEEADALRGQNLSADRDRLPNLPDDEFYHSDLIDLEVLDTGGAILGRVKTVLNHGAGDILEVQLTGKPATALLPFTLAIVPTVDLKAGRIIADPPEGLFE